MHGKKGHTDLQTGNQVVNFAKKRNAHIANEGNFTSIETRMGKMHIKANNEQMDKQTKSNVKKWLKLLGLMMFFFICILPMYLRFMM